MTLYRLRYDPDKEPRFPSIRYPMRRAVPYETAVKMREAMPNPDRFLICEDDTEGAA